MRRIPTLFIRDHTTGLVTPEYNPACEWVLEGKGMPTRMYDGTACMIHDGHLYKRYVLTTYGPTPPSFIPAQRKPDPVTGELPGWIPVGDGPEDQDHREAFQWLLSFTKPGDPVASILEGRTYELIGPNIQGNPEHYRNHVLIPHGVSVLNKREIPTTYEGLKEYFAVHNIEGIVWWRNHDENCRQVKIKGTDFGLRRGER